jgi:hypothetical protein
MSSKDIEKKLVGQPIFKQLIDFIPKTNLIFLQKNIKLTVITRHFPPERS